jgi:hypothetical protein
VTSRQPGNLDNKLNAADVLVVSGAVLGLVPVDTLLLTHTGLYPGGRPMTQSTCAT